MANIDRISNLPDSLLHHIISFLECREAVRTCVLSKSWKNLWASLQFLNLDMLKFEAGENIKERFTKFVNALLLLRDTSDLHTFRLIYDEDYSNGFHLPITTWFLYAIKRNAKVIEIDFSRYERLPLCMFNSETLEDLNLRIFRIDKGIGSRAINLPRLKKLKLWVQFSHDNDILNKLALGCPALEDLYLDDCHMNIRVVSFPKLKYLNISSLQVIAWVECIRAPNLVSLVLDGCPELFKKTYFEKMPSLMNATISLPSWHSFEVKNYNLLHAVANVQNLKLSGSRIKALVQIELSRCPTFFNLTTLSLPHFCMICYSNEIGDILKHTPNLKKLILCGDKDDERHGCYLEAYQGYNSIKSPLVHCKNIDKIEVEFKCINVQTKQLVNTLVESLDELKTTCLILYFNYKSFGSRSLTKLHQFCLSMVQGKDLLTILSDDKFIVWSK